MSKKFVVMRTGVILDYKTREQCIEFLTSFPTGTPEEVQEEIDSLTLMEIDDSRDD